MELYGQEVEELCGPEVLAQGGERLLSRGLRSAVDPCWRTVSELRLENRE